MQLIWMTLGSPTVPRTRVKRGWAKATNWTSTALPFDS